MRAAAASVLLLLAQGCARLASGGVGAAPDAGPVDDGATFDDVPPAPPGTRCDRALPLTLGAATEGVTEAAGDEMLWCHVEGGPYRYYRATLPPSTRIDLRFTQLAESAVHVAGFLDCGLARCDGTNTSIGPRAWSLPFANPTLAPRDWFFAVDSRSTTVPARFRLEPSRPVAIERGQFCELPLDLAVGASATYAVTGVTSPDPRALSPAWYRVTVPARRRVDVAGATPAGVSVGLAVARDCDDLGSSPSTFEGPTMRRFARLTNDADAPRSYLLRGSAGAVRFDVSGALPIEAGQSCARAIALAPGSTARVDFTGGGAHETPCDRSGDPMVYYETTVPAGTRVTLTSGDPDLDVFEGCDAAACGPFNTVPVTVPPAAVPQRVFLAAPAAARRFVIGARGRYGPSAGGGRHAVSLSAAVPLADGDACERAVPLVDGATFEGTTVGASLRPDCQPNESEARFYSVRVPPGRAGVVTVAASSPATVYAASRCTVRSCALVASAAPGAPAVLRLQNDTLAAVSYVVEVAAAASPHAVTYATEDSRPPYLVERADGVACERLVGATRLRVYGERGVAGGEIPFPFRFFGRARSEYTAAVDGHLFLAAPPPAMISTGENGTLPTRALSSPLVAAFWDDLYMDALSSMRVAALGDAPDRRLVFEWRGMLDHASRGGRLQMQLTLREGGGVIDVVYCAVGAEPADRGASATVGLQDEGSADAVMAAYELDDTAAPGRRVRFTPR